MNIISSKEAMLKAYDACKGLLGLRSVAPHDLNSTKKELLCCGGTGCHASNSPLLMENLRAAIKEHGLENDGVWAIECAPWAISVMAPGGTAII
ncbi:MAG: (2Fe-2S) ferredoxin domain-containing protein, partial [Lentisphaeria bacterium]|nr:(2Fe-2S) ferredoxin domain-containing protein [Lentisphaeria bacterium]